MSANTASGTGAAGPSEQQGEQENKSFECNICLDTARDAVVSMCGHLFWWVRISMIIGISCFITDGRFCCG